MFKYEKIILLIMSVVYTIIGCITDNPTIHSLSMMGWFGIIQLIYCIICWMKRGNQFISPYIVFLLTLYIFSYGQSFLWAFGLESERTLIGFRGVIIPEIFKAQVLTIIMLAFFQIGASYYCIKRKNINNTISANVTFRLKKIGWILFAISVLPYSIETYSNMLLSLTSGYGALYEGTAKVGLANWSGIIADYCIPSLICLYIAYRKHPLMRRCITFFFLINIIAILITGGRTFAVILLALVIILYNYLVKRFTRKWLLVGCFGVFFLLQILSYVASVRTDSGRGVSKESVKIENNGAVDAVAEMGGTMFCLIKTMNLVPEHQSYRYGRSYLYAFTSLMPNLGFWDIHPAKKEANLSDWLTDSLGLDYGTGFSMCAEAYANFGYLCFVAFFFWGWFLASVFGKIEISAQTQNYALMAFLLILFWFFLTLPRNNFINLIRPFFFIAGPIYLYCKKQKRKRIKYDTKQE